MSFHVYWDSDTKKNFLDSVVSTKKQAQEIIMDGVLNSPERYNWRIMQYNDKTNKYLPYKQKSKMAKKRKTKSKKSRKMLTGYIGQSAWVLTFTTKSGDKFRKKFKSESSLNRAMAGWTAKGGFVKWTPTLPSQMMRSRGKKRATYNLG